MSGIDELKKSVEQIRIHLCPKKVELLDLYNDPIPISEILASSPILHFSSLKWVTCFSDACHILQSGAQFASGTCNILFIQGVELLCLT